jgi:glycerol-3-phosphate dehydrogenase
MAEWSLRSRAQNLEQLAHNAFDVLVIGGGITGAGVARDAALRGLRVGLVERRDFAVGTSSRSSKLIHGGLRYLRQGDVGLVREAASERRVLRRVVPHLAQPIEMLVPVATRWAYAKVGLGLWAYDRLTRVRAEERHRMLGRAEMRALEPRLRAEALYGAGLYFEGLTDDARLVLETLKSAATLGAVVSNYAEVIRLLSENGRLTAAVVRDTTAGTEFAVRASVIVNAAGPWVDAVRLLGGAAERPRLRLTKGIHLVLRRERLPVSRIVAISTSDNRSIFVVPRGHVVYVGTTDTDYDGRYDDPQITAEDVAYVLDAVNVVFDVDRISESDVVSAWAGLRPLLQQAGKSPTEISRKDEIMLSPAGLISIAGGKLTTYRKMAERVVDTIVKRLSADGRRLPVQRGESDRMRLSGGETGDDLTAFTIRMKQRWTNVAVDIIERLVVLYGSNVDRIADAMMRDPALAQRCAPDMAVTRAEVAYAVHAEMALTLEDVLERRARLFLWDVHNGLTVAAEVARLMGALLGWDAARVDAELADYRQHVRAVKTFSPELNRHDPRA